MPQFSVFGLTIELCNPATKRGAPCQNLTTIKNLVQTFQPFINIYTPYSNLNLKDYSNKLI